jgi:carboxyl-terminal processing protease
MRSTKLLSCAFVVIALAAPVGAVRADDAPPAAPIDAASELHAAIDLLKTHHMNRDKVDWTAVTTHADTMIATAKTAADAYPAILYVIRQLGEKHTVLQAADFVKAMTSGDKTGSPYSYVVAMNAKRPEGYMLAGRIGLLHLDSHEASIAEDAAYVNVLRAELAIFHRQGMCRFLIDLRADSGGNMWPMLNGLASLLGKPPYGYFHPNDATSQQWVLTGFLGMEDTGVKMLPPVVAPAQGRAPVAVLVSPATASAGEFTAMAFEGRARTRFFGQQSAGYITVNRPYHLPDGALLAVSVGWATDRTGKPYRVAIVPDEQTETGQPTIDAAVAWLKNQPCRGE